MSKFVKTLRDADFKKHFGKAKAGLVALPATALIAANTHAFDLAPAVTEVESIGPQATALFAAIVGVLILVVGYRVVRKIIG